MKAFNNLVLLTTTCACSLTLHAAGNEPNSEEALAFLSEAESRLEEAGHELNHASWLANTFINYDSRNV